MIFIAGEFQYKGSIMIARYVLSRGATLAQPYHWVLKAPNGETILTSENYTTRTGALNGIKSAQRNCKSDSNYKRRASNGGHPYFTLNAPENGQVIGVSEMYSSEQMRDKGIISVKTHGTTGVIFEP